MVFLGNKILLILDSIIVIISFGIVVIYYNSILWRDVRVVEGAGLENRCTSNRTGGSNPPLSAIFRV
jgi:hypothetical protein